MKTIRSLFNIKFDCLDVPALPFFLLSFIIAGTMIGFITGCGTDGNESESTDTPNEPGITDARIVEVENNLLPSRNIKGAVPLFMRLPERMDHYNVPGVCIAVIDQYKTAWIKGYGVIQAGEGDAVTTDTLWQVSSLSKPVAALAALTLVNREGIDPAEDVNHFLTSWQIPDNDFTADTPVTLQGLLSHTAGISVDSFNGYGTAAPLPTLLQILNGHTPANSVPVQVIRTPGTAVQHSSGGYMILQMLMEDVLGSAFSDMVQERIFLPLNMENSTYTIPAGEKTGMTAKAHHADRTPVSGGWMLYPELAAAGLWSTAGDMAAILIELQKSFNGSGKILSSDTAKQMMTLLPNFKKDPADPDVFMPEADEYKEFCIADRVIGDNYGYNHIMVGYDNGQGAVVFTNGENGARLAEEIVLSISSVYDWPGRKPAEMGTISVAVGILKQYEGVYFPENSGRESAITVKVENDHLYLFTADNTRMALFAASKDRFFMLDYNMDISFSQDANGNYKYMNLYFEGVNSSFTKIEEAPEVILIPQWTLDDLPAPVSAVHVPDMGFIYASCMGEAEDMKTTDGRITRIDPEGLVNAEKWAVVSSGEYFLKNPMGMTVIDNMLYAADTDRLLGFNLGTGMKTEEYIIGPNTSLSDVAAAPGGTLYIADAMTNLLGANYIYRLLPDASEPELWKRLSTYYERIIPQTLYAESTRLVVGTNAGIYAVNYKTREVTPLLEIKISINGICSDGGSAYFFTSGATLSRLHPTGTAEILMSFDEDDGWPQGVWYDASTGFLLVADMKNGLSAFEVIQ